MNTKHLDGIANEWGHIKPSDYQDLKNKLAFVRAERMDYIASDKELSALFISISSRLLARKRKPENMAREQKKKEGAE